MTLKQKIGRLLYDWLPLSKRSISIIRYETACVMQRLANVFNPQLRARLERISHQKNLLINLGSGGKGKPDWINVEMTRTSTDNCLPLDIRRKLPFADNSARFILIEHVLEHLDPVDDVPALLVECHRILAPQGVLRIIVPDLEKYCAAYVLGTRDAFMALGWDLQAMPADIYTKMHILNNTFHQHGEHLFGWDYETLCYFLGKSGWKTIMKTEFGKSLMPEGAIDQENHQRYSLYVEAVK